MFWAADRLLQERRICRSASTILVLYGVARRAGSLRGSVDAV